MRTNKKQKDLLYIAASSFIVTVAWVGFSIYHNMVTSTISENLQLQIQPIDPNFDKETLQKLKNRQAIQPAFETKTAPTEPAETTPTPLLTPSLPEDESPTPQPTTSKNQVLQPTALPTNNTQQP